MVVPYLPFAISTIVKCLRFCIIFITKLILVYSRIEKEELNVFNLLKYSSIMCSTNGNCKLK